MRFRLSSIFWIILVIAAYLAGHQPRWVKLGRYQPPGFELWALYDPMHPENPCETEWRMTKPPEDGTDPIAE